MTVPYFARLKTVIESDSAAKSADNARSNFDRFDDAWEAFKWLLARRASSLGEAPLRSPDGFRLYTQEGDRIAGAPEIWSVFRVDDEQVEIIAVNFLQAVDDEH